MVFTESSGHQACNLLESRLARLGLSESRLARLAKRDKAPVYKANPRLYEHTFSVDNLPLLAQVPIDGGAGRVEVCARVVGPLHRCTGVLSQREDAKVIRKVVVEEVDIAPSLRRIDVVYSVPV
jgi:hypothetical protein